MLICIYTVIPAFTSVKLNFVGLDNGFTSVLHQTIIGINVDVLLIVPLWTYFSGSRIKNVMQTFWNYARPLSEPTLTYC